jgi:hypothetical protein
MRAARLKRRDGPSLLSMPSFETRRVHRSRMQVSYLHGQRQGRVPHRVPDLRWWVPRVLALVGGVAVIWAWPK